MGITTKSPQISVLMPVYNAEKYLKEAIDSILGQTFTDFEFIIVNDGSTDSSRNVILSYKDKRIKFIDNKKNEGIINALNTGLDHATGEYIARMDADDISFPVRFERQLKIMTEYDIDVCGTTMRLIDEEGKKIGYLGPKSVVYSDMPASILNVSTWILHPTAMMKSFTIKEVGGYRPEAKHVDDFDLWARLLINKYKEIVIPEILVDYRQYKEQRDKYKRLQDEFREQEKMIVYNYIQSILNSNNSTVCRELTFFFLRSQSNFKIKKRINIDSEHIFRFRKAFKTKFSYIENSLIGLDKRIAQSALGLIKDSDCSLHLRMKMTFVYAFARLSVYGREGMLIKGLFKELRGITRGLIFFLKKKIYPYIRCLKFL